MKKITKLIAGFILVGSLTVSCIDGFDEMNTSRSLITSDLVDVNMMFTRVLGLGIVERPETGLGTTGNWAGMSVSGANRPFDEGASPGVWNNSYSDYIRNLNDIIHLSQEADAVNKKSIARILRVFFFARVTDTYGDIPYFQSALPVESAVTSPVYDAQRDIYVDFFKELREAAAALDETKESFGNADILYQGNVTKWRKFANSLRLRLALRIRYADEALGRQEMADLTEADLITARADDASIYNISDFPSHKNPQFVDLESRKNTVVKGSVAKTFLDILQNNNDPRLPVFVDTVKAWFPQTPGYMHVPYFGYRGRPLLGSSNPQEGYAYGDNTVSQWSDLLWVEKQELPLYKASETYFNLAEAALFGMKGTAGEAQAYFQKGMEIALSHTMEMYEDAVPQLRATIALFNTGKSAPEIDAIVANTIEEKKITQTDIDSFLASPAATLTGNNEEKLEQIINQKIIALFPMEHEGWVEYRRTGYPRILVGFDLSALQGKMPRRMPYPDDEQLINGTEYQKVLARMGGAGADNRLTRVWWDANPNPVKVHPGTVETRTKPWIEDIQ